MQSLVEIEYSTGALLADKPSSNKTIELDCDDGDEECARVPDRSGLLVKKYSSMNSAQDSSSQWRFEGAGNDPCFTGSPDVDWKINGFMKYNKVRGVLAVGVSGLVDAFPSFEMYAQIGGKVDTLFTKSPNAGSSAWGLAGPPNRLVFGNALFVSV